MTSSPIQFNQSWMALVRPVDENLAGLYTRFLAENEDLQAVLASREDTKDLIETLQGFDIRDSKGPYTERRRRFKAFYDFLKRQSDAFDKDAQVTQIFPKVFDRKQALLANPELAQREVEASIAGIDTKDLGFVTMLDLAIIASGKFSSRAELITGFLLSQQNMDKLAPRLRAILGQEATVRDARTGRCLQPQEARQTFHNFLSYAQSQDLQFDLGAVAAAVPEEYFGFDDLSNNRDYLARQVEGMVKRSTKTNRWQKYLVDLAGQHDSSIGQLIAGFALSSACTSSPESLKSLKEDFVEPLLARTMGHRDLFRSFLSYARSELGDVAELNDNAVADQGLAAYFDFGELAQGDKYLQEYLSSRVTRDTAFNKSLQTFCKGQGLNIDEVFFAYVCARNPDRSSQEAIDASIAAINLADDDFMTYLETQHKEHVEHRKAFLAQQELRDIEDGADHTVNQIWFDCVDDASKEQYGDELDKEHRRGLLIRDFLSTQGFDAFADQEQLRARILVLIGDQRELDGSEDTARKLYRDFTDYLKTLDTSLRDRDMYVNFPEAIDLFPELYEDDESVRKTTMRFILSGEMKVREEWFKPFETHVKHYIKNKQITENA